MSRIFESSLATVLDKQVRGENVIHLRVFCAEAGLILLLKKVSSKKTDALPDYFDDISLSADYAKTGDLKFLRKHELIKSRTQIARDYDAFSHSAAISSVILNNGANIENATLLSERFRKTLDAMTTGAPASIARLKFMYLLVRDEGYPVLEDFYSKLSPENSRFFTTLIRTPLSELAEFRSRATELLDKLCLWIHSNTDIVE